jgi:hypothetical protein
MRRICAIAALALAVPFFSSDEASAFDAPRLGNVTAVSISPAAGRANVLIAISGQTRVLDFTLPDPSRIVLDITPARLAAVPAYDKTPRGGVTNVRFTQYEQDVVRVVLDLDKQREYELSVDSTGIRVSVDAQGAGFTAWTSEATPRNVGGISVEPASAAGGRPPGTRRPSRSGWHCNEARRRQCPERRQRCCRP